MLGKLGFLGGRASDTPSYVWSKQVGQVLYRGRNRRIFLLAK